MDLTIDEKMQLVQKMRAQEDARNTALRYSLRTQTGNDRHEAANGILHADDPRREGRFFLPAVRVILSICLLGCYLYLQYGHASISGIGASDVSAYISADGLRPGHSGDK